MPTWKAARTTGFDRLAARRTALASAKSSSRLKASPPARCFAYLMAVLANTKRTIRLFYAAVGCSAFALTGHFEFSVKKQTALWALN